MRARFHMFFGLLLLILLSVGCDDRAVFAGTLEVPGGTWEMAAVQQFEFEWVDTLPAVDVYLQLRNNDAYPFQNIFLFMETTFPDGALRRDTISIALAASDGRWLGSGAGSAYDNDILVMRGVKWPVTGTYRVTLQHGMRPEALKGVERIGLILRRDES